MYFSCLSCFMFNFNSCIQNVRPSLPSSHMSLYVRSGVTVSTVSCRYFVCVAVLLYFLPLLVMGCAYLVVGLTLWASEIPGDSSDRYKEQLTAKRKVTCNQITPLPSACVVPPVRNLSPESQPLSLSLSPFHLLFFGGFFQSTCRLFTLRLRSSSTCLFVVLSSLLARACQVCSQLRCCISSEDTLLMKTVAGTRLSESRTRDVNPWRLRSVTSD